MISKKTRNILLRACPRCRGDLLWDINDDEFACLQCGRRIGTAMLEAAKLEAGTQKTLAPAA